MNPIQIKELLTIDTIANIKNRMKYCTFMKKKHKAGSPEFEYWSGRRVGLRIALISLRLTIKEIK